MSKRKRAHHERPTILTVWIGVLALIGVYQVVNGVSEMLRPNNPSVIGFVSGLVLLGLVAGLWNWQRWAYYGILAAYALVALIVLAATVAGGIVTSAMIVLGFSLAVIAITVAVIHPRLSWFH